ncbi:MAG: endonuclease VII domain-containing protein [Janthinobacterium lividum]
MKILKTTRGSKAQHLENYADYTHKECTKCSLVKPVGEFSKGAAKNSLGWAYRGYCKECGNAQTRAYSKGNTEKRNTRLREYRKANPEKAKLYDKRGSFKKKYGITLDQLEFLKKHNDYKCWICNKPHPKLFMDHCHTTGKVRGMLCPGCNTYLGVIQDSADTAQRLLDYLKGAPCHADVLLAWANADPMPTSENHAFPAARPLPPETPQNTAG